MTDRVDISRLLGDMRQLKMQTQAFKPQALQETQALRSHGPVSVGQPSNVPSFSEMMGQAINKVNGLQQHSSSMATQYEKGVAGIDITDVMVASQKASVAFQATVQVRNKLIEAYRDVMNMPI